MGSYASVTISGTLIGNVRKLYQLGSQDSLSGKVSRHGLNAYTDYALSSYIIGVASVEAFVNENFLSNEAEILTAGSSLWKLRKDWLARLELRDKMILVTQLLFGKAMDPGAQPLQDFALLLRVRNESVHYKRGAPPNFMSEFITRDIALTSGIRKKQPESQLSQPWAWDLQCTEGIRWAHNVCCRVVHALVESMPITDDKYATLGVASVTTLDNFRFLHTDTQRMASNFTEISEPMARSFYTDLDLDPDSE